MVCVAPTRNANGPYHTHIRSAQSTESCHVLIWQLRRNLLSGPRAGSQDSARRCVRTAIESEM
eukprot:6205437-Pleurochrysis_carterae.AAC.1